MYPSTFKIHVILSIIASHTYINVLCLYQATAERDEKRRRCLEQEEELSNVHAQTSFSDKQLSKKLSEMKEEYELIKEQVVNIMK